MIEEDRYLRAYFGKQSDYYLEQYRAYHAGDRFTFNVGAFFTGLFWFLYRKMFIGATIIFVVNMLLSILEDFLYTDLQVNEGMQKIIFFASTLAFGLLFGFIGNMFYFRQADKKIKSILSKTEDEVERMDLLRSAGGTSWAPFVLLAIFILIFIILNGTQ